MIIDKWDADEKARKRVANQDGKTSCSDSRKRD